MQLKQCIVVGALVVAASASAGPVHADDRVEASTTWYQEGRKGNQGGLTVIHPQVSGTVDVGKHTTLGILYSADAVTGATASVYAVDAVSSATKFYDFRNQGGLSLGFFGPRSRFTLSGGVGSERDYLSLSVGADVAIELPGRNTTLALSYGRSFDSVCDRDNGNATPLERRALTKADVCAKQIGVVGKDTMGTTRWASLDIDTAQATVTQNLSPTMNVQVALYGQVLRGLQSNPYRRVRVGPNEPQEYIPNSRARASLSARVNRYLPKVNAALHLDARGYSDTWGVNSGMVEFAYSQYAGTSVLLRVRARFSQQTAATFFKDAFFYETESTAGAYFTGDRELSPVQNVLIGAKLTIVTVGEEKPVLGMFDKLEFNLKGDALRFRELAADDPSANPLGRDNQFLVGGGLIDAVVLQLGLTGNY